MKLVPDEITSFLKENGFFNTCGFLQEGHMFGGILTSLVLVEDVKGLRQHIINDYCLDLACLLVERNDLFTFISKERTDKEIKAFIHLKMMSHVRYLSTGKGKLFFTEEQMVNDAIREQYMERKEYLKNIDDVLTLTSKFISIYSINPIQ